MSKLANPGICLGLLSTIVANVACDRRSHDLSLSTLAAANDGGDLVEDFAPGQWRLEISNQNRVSTGTDTWHGLDESQVFLKRLTHIQDGANWTIKLGKGGQIYSVSTPESGELVAAQRQEHGQWIDEVFQHTIPSNLHNGENSSPRIVDGDIHQAGYYTISDLDRKQQLLSSSFYSPTFAAYDLDFLRSQNSVALTTWPQHAHLPRTYTENGMFMQQRTRDLGDGVVEITVLIDKWHGEETKAVSMPWSAWRKANAPATLIANVDGTYTRDDQNFSRDAAKGSASEGGMRRLTQAGSPATTGGWIAVAQADDDAASGVGIVFGKYASASDDGVSYLRWGDYGSGSERGTIITIKRGITLRPGDSVYFRYYLVIGRVEKIRHYGNLLASHVEVRRSTAANDVNQRICVAKDKKKSLRRGCSDGSTPVFYTERNFRPGTKPLFLLGQSGASYRLSSDPYEISEDPTDRKTEYASFLGWASNEPLETDAREKPLGEFASISGLSLSESVTSLYVLAAE